jgi:amidohydrolase
VYNGANPGRTVLIRTELDALPIHEVNEDIPYRSVHDGIGHKCGHDGHMTIVAGVAQTLAERPAKGRVVLLFQPDEETGTGARECHAHENFQKIRPDYAFALHNLPGFTKGEVFGKVGTFASAVKYVAIKMSGVETHSAQPETGVSPSFALAELTLMAQEVQAKYDDPDAYALIVPIFNQMGVQSSGVCPAKGEAHFTLRSGRGTTVEAMWEEFLSCARIIAEKHGLNIEIETKEEFAETATSDSAFDLIKTATENAGLGFNLIDRPFRWGEDFGEITGHYEGGMFGLGAGRDQPDLHTPNYDFPDDLLVYGIRIFTQLISDTLAEAESEKNP